MDSRPYLKTVLYILSLWLLFLSLLIMSYDKVLIKMCGTIFLLKTLLSQSRH